MQVNEIMTRGAELIGPNTTIREAAAKMHSPMSAHCRSVKTIA